MSLSGTHHTPLIYLSLSCRAELRLTVENISTLPIDYLDLSFEDSLKSRMLQLLAEGDLSAFETYEMEYSLVEKSVFSWNSKRERGEIRPGEESVISVKCFGQAGWSVMISVHRLFELTFADAVLTATFLSRILWSLAPMQVNLLSFIRDI